jgi:glycosyltransferase involved in cell wall biosynthesis
MTAIIKLKSITFLTNCLDYGGREVQMLQLATQLSLRGWDVKIISMQAPVAFMDDLKLSGIPVRSLGMERGIPNPMAIWHLARLIKEWKPQILHSHLIHATLLARITRVFVNIPVVIATIGNVKQGSHFHEIICRLTDPLCNLTTNNSKVAVERYINDKIAPKHKIIYIPNSIDSEKFFFALDTRLNIRNELEIESQFVWLAVGRFEVQKDYPNLLYAFSKVSQSFSNTVLLICGKGSLEEKIKDLVVQLNLQSQVTFLGIRQDVSVLMNAADAYVMSSAWEGMPGVLLEASATSLPIVATDVSGNREVVVDGKSGFLVPPQNSDALACAMEKLMQLPESERKQMGYCGREHTASCFGLEKGVKTWEDLYFNLLNNKV